MVHTNLPHPLWTEGLLLTSFCTLLSIHTGSYSPDLLHSNAPLPGIRSVIALLPIDSPKTFLKLVRETEIDKIDAIHPVVLKTFQSVDMNLSRKALMYKYWGLPAEQGLSPVSLSGASCELSMV